MSNDRPDVRTPTSHERASGHPWDASYHDGPPPWDIGRPQPAIERLIASGALVGPVLDVGCGTGDNALRLASTGVEVVGVDVAPTAIDAAREKAMRHGLAAQFAVGDALRLHALGRTFPTVLDCGLFHTFDTEEQRDYAASVATVTAHGGRLYILCFSDQGAVQGPHPVSEANVRRAFEPGTGWKVASIAPELTYARFNDAGLPAWLVTVTRTPLNHG